MNPQTAAARRSSQPRTPRPAGGRHAAPGRARAWSLGAGAAAAVLTGALLATSPLTGASAAVDPVQGYDPADTGSLWSVGQIVGAPAAWSAGYTGAGVDVAVVDTGVARVPGLDGADKVIDGPDLSFDSQGAVPSGVDESVQLKWRP